MPEKKEVVKEVRAVKLHLKEKPAKGDQAKEKKEEDMLFVPEIIIYNHETRRNETYNDCQNFAHKDFVKAVLSLREHYAILLTFHEVEDFENKVVDPKKFKSRGFSISGAEDETRLCLKGHFLTDIAGACAVNVNNIFLEKDMDAEGGYDLIDDLKGKIDRIKLEAIAYLFDNKRMADPQLDMFDEKVTKAKVLPEAKPGENGTFKGDSATSIGGVAAAIVEETNRKQQENQGGGGVASKGQGSRGGKKLPQTPDNKSGAAKN